jgi:hypothetical protein
MRIIILYIKGEDILKEIWETISPYLIQILATVLAAVLSYIGLKIKKIYETKFNSDTKKDIAKLVVEMVEQIATKYNWTSEEKHNKAKETMTELLNNETIKATDLELEVLIESACRLLKAIPPK